MASKILIIAYLVLGASWKAYGIINCSETGSGVFADPSDTTYRRFTTCVYDSVFKAFAVTNYVCESGKEFRPSAAACVDSNDYDYNDVVTSTDASTTTLTTTTADTTTTEVDTTTTVTTTTDATTEVDTTTTTDSASTTTTSDTTTTDATPTTAAPESTFNCSSPGRFPNPSDSTCGSYYFCVQFAAGNYLQELFTCPPGSYFDPDAKFCTSSYNCSVEARPSLPALRTDGSEAHFSCANSGRFANTADTTCESYFFCVLTSDGTLGQYQYTCPSGSRFNPATRICTSSYSCTTS